MAELINYARENILNSLETRLGLTNQNKDSFARIISEVIGSELNLIESEVIKTFRNEQIENLVGESLDDFVFNNFGVTRFPAKKAESTNVQVYVRGNKTFGEINSGNDIVLPAGTILSNVKSFETATIRYLTKETVTLNSQSAVSYVSVIAENPGSNYNIVENGLTFVNFENFTNSSSEELACLNIQDISNGSDVENDFSLRLRGIKYLESRSNLNKNALFLSILSEPSIFDFDLIESYFGIGTLGVIVRGHGYGAVSDNDLIKVKRILNEISFLGQYLEVVTPIKVIPKIIIAGASSNENKDLLKNDIINFVNQKLKLMEYERSVNFLFLEESILKNFNISRLNSRNNLFISIEITKQERNSNDTSFEEIDFNLNNGYILKKDETFSTPEIEITIVEE